MCKVIDRFFKKLELENRESSVVSYKTDLADFVKFIKEEKNIETFDEEIIKTISNDDIEDYIYRSLTLYKKTTINRRLISLKLFFEYCKVNKKIITENPCDGVKGFTKGLDVQHKQVLSLEECHRVLDATQVRNKGDRDFEFMSSRNYLLLSLLMSTGLRINEALTLTESDIEKFESTYLIRIKEDVAKNGKERFVPLTRKVKIAYEKYLIEREKYNKKDSDLLFISARGEQVTVSNTNSLLSKLMEICSIDKRISNHSIRATCKTQLTISGVNSNIISLLLGHSLNVIEETYIRTTTEMYLSMIDAMEKLGF